MKWSAGAKIGSGFGLAIVVPAILGIVTYTEHCFAALLTKPTGPLHLKEALVNILGGEKLSNRRDSTKEPAGEGRASCFRCGFWLPRTIWSIRR